jgi:predicted alpha/beta-fold hydrolase
LPLKNIYLTATLIAAVHYSTFAAESRIETSATTPANSAVAVLAPAPALAPGGVDVDAGVVYQNGLYASAAGYLCLGKVCFPCQKSYVLDVCKMSCRFPVKAAIQDHAAPLVVVLLGITGSPDEDFSKLWASWYADAGYHVLAFQSTFVQEFNQRSQHGVCGNMWAETDLVVNIINAFLHQTPVEGQVTKIGIAGMSYGAVEALMLGTMAGPDAKKKLPFEIAAIQAYSPPIRIEQSARIVDGWYAQTYGKYTLVQLLQLLKYKPDPATFESEVPEDMLKCAIATSFRLSLPSLIAYSDSNYHLHKLPKGDEFTDRYVREDYASRWSFIKFAYGMSYPYWQEKLNMPSLEPLVKTAELPALFAKQPAYSEVILAEDDPLNSTEDSASFKAFAAGKRITVLKHGGHLGYISQRWTRKKLMTLFDPK